MATTLYIRNISATKRLVRRDVLERLASRICAGESAAASIEISLLLCDDEYMGRLNRQYRNKKGPTDVLSFEQDGPEGPILGDVAISLETALRYSGGDRALARKEAGFLFCHGLLHLLGYNHSTRAEREEMTRKQAQYLGISERAAWPSSSPNQRESTTGPMQPTWR